MIIKKTTVKHNPIYDKTMNLGNFEIPEYKFCLKLEYFRKLLGISQTNFALVCGFEPNNLYRYEKNKITPSSGVLKKITDGINSASLLLTDGKDCINISMNDMLSLSEDTPDFKFTTTLTQNEVEFSYCEKSYNLSSNVAYYRKTLGLSQSKLAEYLGIKRGAFSYYELIEYIPSPEKLQLLIDAFRSLSDLMSGGKEILNLTFDDLLKFELI